MHRRASGILLHITSLPASYGIGDFGPAARRFVDFLHQADQSYWQVLPLTPTSSYIGNSPYSSDSAFAINPLFLGPEVMVEDGWLDAADIAEVALPLSARVDYEAAEAVRERLSRLAFERAADRLDNDPGFAAFCRDEAHWLDNFTLFRTLKRDFQGAAWFQWPDALRDRRPEALEEVRRREAGEIRYLSFVQYLLYGQWRALRQRMAGHGIQVVGDLPIYVTEDSADVWADQELFKLGPDKRPVFVAGVPPDYFSETGQRWGNPVFDWPEHEKTGFAWWLRRVGHNLRLFDVVRLDHFRGFEAYWEIPAEEKTAVRGQWVKAPGRALFREMTRRFPSLPIIAEDLGVITAEVRELKAEFGFPGMKILQFAFGPGIGENRDAPHNHEELSVVYTGTHDNTTTLGWIRGEAGKEGRRLLSAYLGRTPAPEETPWALIRLAMMSVARLAVVPMQDVLGLGASARMNMPSVAKGNWTWRMTGEEPLAEAAARLRFAVALYGRDHGRDPQNGGE